MGTPSQRICSIGLQAACAAMVVVSTAYATKVPVRQFEALTTRTDVRLSDAGGQLVRPVAHFTQVSTPTVTAYTVAVEGMPEASGAGSSARAAADKRSPVESYHVRFAKGKDDVRQKQKRKLDTVAEKLAANPAYTADIDAPVYRKAGESYNDTLTWKRREAVHRYLVEKHSDVVSRVFLVGAGQDLQPKMQAANRDVTVTIYKPAK